MITSSWSEKESEEEKEGFYWFTSVKNDRF